MNTTLQSCWSGTFCSAVGPLVLISSTRLWSIWSYRFSFVEEPHGNNPGILGNLAFQLTSEVPMQRISELQAINFLSAITVLTFRVSKHFFFVSSHSPLPQFFFSLTLKSEIFDFGAYILNLFIHSFYYFFKDRETNIQTYLVCRFICQTSATAGVGPG